MPKKDQLLDYERIRFLRLLLGGALKFREIYGDYQKHGTLPQCADVESLCRDWFEALREKAHAIFRRSPATDEEARLHDYELLCDLVIGVCYHESLQLQENLYLSKLYRVRYDDLRGQMAHADVEEYFQIGENLIRDATAQIPKNLDSIQQLLLEALTLMKKILSAHSENRVILRFLAQNLDLVREVYGPDSAEELFLGLYPGGIAEGLWRATTNLMESAHYQQALGCASRLALLVQNESFPDGFDRSDVAKALNKIHKEGKALRDNDLVTRSQNLLRQFQENTVST